MIRSRLTLPGLRRLAAGAAVVLAPAAALAADSTFPKDASPNGKGVDELFWLATWLTGVAFALVVAILLYFVIAYRARPGRKAEYIDGSSKRAKTVTAVFAVVVFISLDVVLAVKDESVWHQMYGDRATLAEKDAMVVQCLAKQFEWLFRYPGKDGKFGTADDLRSQVLYLPDDRPTIVRLRSIDVIHSFFIPNWRTKQDAMPGMFTTSVVHPRRGETGEFAIACAELCGLGHYRMKGRIVVQSREEFDAWVKGQEKELEEYGASTQGEEFWAQYEKRSRKGESK